MKRVAVIGLFCVLAWCQIALAGGRPAQPRQDGFADIVCDILLAPCNLLAQCLGVSQPPYRECVPVPAPCVKIRKKPPRQPSEARPPTERTTPRRGQSTTNLTPPKRQETQATPTTRRPLTAPPAPQVIPSGGGPEQPLPKPRAREVVPPAPAPVPPGVKQAAPPSPGTPYAAPGSVPTPPSETSEPYRKKPVSPAVQAPRVVPVPTGTPPEKKEKTKQPSVERKGPGRPFYPPSGCYPPPRCW
jgi:hypothetical protein